MNRIRIINVVKPLGTIHGIKIRQAACTRMPAKERQTIIIANHPIKSRGAYEKEKIAFCAHRIFFSKEFVV